MKKPDVEDRHMFQHVDEPTHISGNLLDLVLSSDENVVGRADGRKAGDERS